jgi:hypothetical protein
MGFAPDRVASNMSDIVLGEQEAKYRLIQDQFLTPEECALLSDFTRQNCVIGDGYGGNPHPHTLTETFSGFSFDGNSVNPELPEYRLALEVMLRARNLLRRQFRLPMLWLEFGHLVKREATGSADAPTEDFSHPWHYDNQSDKYRSHTAILYINDGFEGGHTCFKEADFGPFREVKPKAGTLVSFSVAENAHAVTKLISGDRYVLNMWFSTNWRKYFKHRKIFRPL